MILCADGFSDPIRNRKMRVKQWIASIAFSTLILSGTAAHAQQITLNAVSYEPIPSGEAVMVEIFDDSDDNKRLKAKFEDQLKSQGYTVSENARLIMSFETRDTSGTWTGGGPNRLVEIGNAVNHTGTDAPDVRVNIFDNQRGGLLNPKPNKGVTQVAPSQYRIEASLEDRSNGKRLWQGWSVANNGGADDPALLNAMVKPIVEHIGKTVRDQRISGR